MGNVTDHRDTQLCQCQKTIERWLLTKEEEKGKALNELLQTWDIPFFLGFLFENYARRQYLFAPYVKECSAWKRQTVPSHRIAVYYYRYGKGGVERVLSYLLPLYIQAGYEVVLITDGEPDTGDYPLPSGTKRYLIPKQGDVLSGRKACSERLKQLVEILRAEHIDTLCYHASSNPLLFYDLVAAKSLGIKFIITKHEMFSQHMAVGRDVITEEMDVYPLADLLTVLSSEEEVFWRTLGVKSLLIPNPIGELYAEDYKYNDTSPYSVWVGRLDRSQKQYQDIVPIMREVVKELPECCLSIYGNTDGYRDQYLLEEQIKESGLEGNIKYRGYCTEVEEIYKDAGVLLVTSAYESFSMVILESKQLGIPLITYSMPYLELLKDKKGFMEVRQGDILAAAQALVQVLSDRELRRNLSREAKQSIWEKKADRA